MLGTQHRLLKTGVVSSASPGIFNTWNKRKFSVYCNVNDDGSQAPGGIISWCEVSKEADAATSVPVSTRPVVLPVGTAAPAASPMPGSGTFGAGADGGQGKPEEVCPALPWPCLLLCVLVFGH